MIQATGPGTKSAQFTHSYLLILQTVSIYRCKDNPREGCTRLQSPSLCCEMQYVLISERAWEGTGDNEGLTWWSARQLPTHFPVTLKHLDSSCRLSWLIHTLSLPLSVPSIIKRHNLLDLCYIKLALTVKMINGQGRIHNYLEAGTVVWSTRKIAMPCI